MLIRIEPTSDKPIYMQLADAVAREIGSGAMSAGERLPSARTLGANLGINMHTVLKAYSHLADRGMVEMRRGRGGVVVRRLPDIRIATRSLIDLAKRKGLSLDKFSNMIEEEWV